MLSFTTLTADPKAKFWISSENYTPIPDDVEDPERLTRRDGVRFMDFRRPNQFKPTECLEITNELIIEIIGADEIFRGLHGQRIGWPLYNENQLAVMMLGLRFTKYKADMPYHTTNLKKTMHCNFNAVREAITEYYDAINHILDLGEGHVILAGGSVTDFLSAFADLITYPMNNKKGDFKDFDFFFVSFDMSDPIAAQRKADAILKSIIDYFTDPDNEFIINTMWRNQNVFTVEIRDERGNLPKLVKYQFVLRLYPDVGDLNTNMSLVVGGFDLYPSACLYAHDRQFYATPAAAFCLSTRYNLMALSRASTSMIYRYRKYTLDKGFRIIFPSSTWEKCLMMNPHNTGCLYYDQKLKDLDNLDRVFVCDFPGMRGIMRDNECGLDHMLDAVVADYGTRETDELLHFMMGKTNQMSVNGSNWDELMTPKQPSYENFELSTVETLRNVGNDERLHELERAKTKLNFARYLLKAAMYLRLKHDVTTTNQQYKEFMNLAEQCDTELLQAIKDHKSSQLVGKLRRQAGIYKSKAGVIMKTYIDKWLDREAFKFVNMERDAIIERIIFSYHDRGEDAIIEALEAAFDKYKPTIEWNTINPMAQHTGSFNWIIYDPKDWYGEDFHEPRRIGFPDEIYKVIRRSATLNGFGATDFKNVLIPYFARAWAEDVYERLFAKAEICQSGTLSQMYLSEMARIINSGYNMQTFNMIQAKYKQRADQFGIAIEMFRDADCADSYFKNTALHDLRSLKF